MLGFRVWVRQPTVLVLACDFTFVWNCVWNVPMGLGGGKIHTEDDGFWYCNCVISKNLPRGGLEGGFHVFQTLEIIVSRCPYNICITFKAFSDFVEAFTSFISSKLETYCWPSFRILKERHHMFTTVTNETLKLVHLSSFSCHDCEAKPLHVYNKIIWQKAQK